jgi:hypothetical protein
MIRAVFRVQCDGPCKGWLSVPPHLVGRDLLPGALTVEPTAQHAGNRPGERAARRAAERAGWRETRSCGGASGTWLCPACVLNPLGIVLPKPHACDDPEVGHQSTAAGVCAFCRRRM